MKRSTILVDMDSVLANITDYWLEEIFQRSGKAFTKDNILDFEIHKALDLPEDLIYSIIDTPGFFYRAKVIEHSQEVLRELWIEHKCYICSAASYRNNATQEKWLWLQKHFSFIEKTRVIFTKDKSIINGDYLIDDAPHNLKSFPKTPIIFTQPWNKHLAIDNAIRVNSWLDIAKHFLE